MKRDRVVPRALKPGGLLIGHVPEKNWKPLLSTRTTWPGERRHGCTESEIRDMLGRAGLEQCPSPRQPVSSRCSVAKSPADRTYRGGLLTRLVWFPFAVAFTWLDRGGITGARQPATTSRRGALCAWRATPKADATRHVHAQREENGLGHGFCLWLLARELDWDVEIVAQSPASPGCHSGRSRHSSTFVSDPVGAAERSDVLLALKPWPG